MKYMRVLFIATIVAAVGHGLFGADSGVETDEQFIARMCVTMGWTPEDVDIHLCRMLDEEMRKWK